MESADELKNVIGQIEKTSFFINSHTKGHFVSEAQFALIKKSLKIDNLPVDSDSEEQEAGLDKLCKQLLAAKKTHTDKKANLQNQLALTTVSKLRNDLNQKIQAENSAISKLDKELKKLGL